MIVWRLPKEAIEDPFRPPQRACNVFCLHCGKHYSSDKIRWRRRGGQWAWCCPTAGCEGMGFRFDIFPLTEPSGAGGEDGKRRDDWQDEEDD